MTPATKLFDSGVDAHKAYVLLVTCVDFRLRYEVADYMQKRGLTADYDEITLPGSSLGVMNDVYPHWKQAFLEQFRLLKKIHHFNHVIFMDHCDCRTFAFFYFL